MIHNMLINTKYYHLIFLISFLISLAINICLTKITINYFKKNPWKSYVKKYYTRNIDHKMTTPSFGGVPLVISTITTVIFFINTKDFIILNLCFIFISFFLLGLVDDIIKLKKNSDGISVKNKFIIQLILSIIACYFYFSTNIANNYLYLIPYYEYFINLGILYKIFLVLFIVGYSNATNLTDGIDELLAKLTIMILVSIIILIFICDKQFVYLSSVSRDNLVIFSIALLGSIIGFLWFNSNPADIFMGDSGSLSIGASIALIAVYIRSEILLLILGAVFVIETLSVVVQVLYFKISKGKRMFLMSPIHHHFQKLGISDAKIITKFTIISLVISISILMLLFNIK